MYPLTPWVKRLLVANVAVFVAGFALPRLYVEFALVPSLILARPWTAITYMFLHAGFMHILFNMIGLFFFGPRLEERMGSGGFLKLYFLSGIGGAVFSFIFAPEAPVVGASAAVYGILLAFAIFWPRERIYIWGVLPVEAWLLATLLVGASLWSGIAGGRSGIAHFAHLGGLAFGFVYLKWWEWRQGSARRAYRKKLEASPGAGSGSVDRGALKRWETIRVEGLHELNREEVRVLLEKARTLGPKGLSTEERQFLDRMAAASGR